MLASLLTYAVYSWSVHCKCALIQKQHQISIFTVGILYVSKRKFRWQWQWVLGDYISGFQTLLSILFLVANLKLSWHYCIMQFVKNSIDIVTRMHSSRMCTIHCSGRLSCHTCPLPTTHTHCHAHPLPHMPACHTSCLPCTCPPSHMPPCHTCLPATHVPYHTCSPAMHAPPPHCVCPPTCHSHPFYGQNSWHRLVKTQPFRNYCCRR